MRLALGWAWDPASGYLEYRKEIFDSWSGPRPIFPYQKRQTTTDTHEPLERSLETVSQKNPSAATNKGEGL